MRKLNLLVFIYTKSSNYWGFFRLGYQWVFRVHPISLLKKLVFSHSMNKRNFKISLWALMMLFIVAACGSQPKKTVTKKPTTTQPVPPKKDQPTEITTAPKDADVVKVSLPEVKREFRAAWIASVANINWPSRKDLTTDQQKAEAITILETLRNNNFNAVILQVRPSADALYKSDLEPWSYFLTGEIGRAPYPAYDPLEFWVEESHKRGIEIHVWLNPYRAHHTGGGSVTSESMVRRSGDNVVRLKNGMYWFDPSSDQTQDHVSNVVRDIVKRYDVDGIHFDDYFYPYATYNGGADFPDSKTWNDYRNSGGTLSRADWRRANVNKFVERIYREIKSEKNYVKFGISPFGIWKPGYPQGITGSSQYDELYADAKLWLNQGWVDYFSPQLYWPIESKGQSFPALLQWWKDENTKNRHVWPGLNTVEIKVSDRPREIVNQIQMTRSILQKDAGEIHYSMAGLTKNANMLPSLKNGPYYEQALIPRSPWLKPLNLTKPTINYTQAGTNVMLQWSSSTPENVYKWLVYTQYGNEWEMEIVERQVISKSVAKTKNGKNLNTIAIKAVDRLSNESDYVAKRIK